MPREAPRVTGYIRRFGKVTSRQSVNFDEVSKQNLEIRRQQRIIDQDQGTRLWKELRNICKRNGGDGEKILVSIRELVAEIIGPDSNPSLIDDAALSAVRTCKNVDKFSHSFHSDLKALIGASLTVGKAEKLLSLVHSLTTRLDHDEKTGLEIEALLSGKDNSSQGPNQSFGHDIPFPKSLNNSSIHANDPSFAKLTDLRDNAFVLKNELTFDLNAIQSQTEASASFKLIHDSAWLEAQIKKCYGDESPAGLSVTEFCLTLMTLLSSKRSSDELQTELFDLIGFERIDMIQMILEHRDELVQSHATNKKAIKSEMASAAYEAKLQQQSSQRPNYGCQVLVQSEEERQLKKQARRDEKKLQRILNKLEPEDDEEEFQFDPVDLRIKRQAALASAKTKPMFKSDRGASETTKTYPFVFDSYSQTKAAAGFIQGVKMALPTGFERKDEKKFEEVTIPASEPADLEIGRKRVPIASLDEVGQAAFANTKELNRIQSVVFDAAYQTNENLLVCAPTGAGKTNVAMLCIVQTIKQHIENGVIKKDAFKIVYVAPMKALAAEMTANFGKRLAPLGISVRELTGDMQLTKTEILNTQMLVTTPEKWDVVTRKPGDVSLAQLVRLLIIDEVHLLHGDRGPVVEALVSRTLRMVESSQTMIRIVGLSATLPNYIDVATFLRVNPYVGLFFFDSRFRPVPLAQTFIGVKALGQMQQFNDTNEICYDKVVDFLKKGHQVMVFVHARNMTVKTGMQFKEFAQNRGQTTLFEAESSVQLGQAKTSVSKSRNKQLVELFNSGIGFHHAGMLRSDRNLVEKMFSQGLIKVLVCTATLAWGVNLPAHAVIIKGTEIYDAKKGTFVDVGILDVLQIFGRAGRPQFDKSGHGTIITSHDKLAHYLSLITNQFPIESNFVTYLADNLNAEVSLGTVTNVDEAVKWLSYSYLFVRMRKNPLVYGINYQELRDDPTLANKRRDIIIDAARKLDKAKMVRFDERTQYLFATDLGRTSSHFYIKYDTIEVFNEHMKPVMNDADIMKMLSQAQEFEQLKVRDDELDELDDLMHNNCEMIVSGGSENVHGKVSILLQTHISRGRVNSFSLISDQNYIVQNATRIARALFEIVLRKNWPLLAGRVLKFAKMIEKQMWDFESPLKQHLGLKYEVLTKLETRNFTLDRLREMDGKEIGHLIHHVKAGSDVKKAALEIPVVEIEANIQPITRTVLRVRLSVTPNFKWNDRVHGATAEPFWIWVEDPENNHIYHHESFLLTKKQVKTNEVVELVFTIPIFEPLPSQYYVRAISDRWLGSETYCPISFQHLILPERHPPHTELLDLQPLPVTALDNLKLEALFKFPYFNPIQTQIFHVLYHTDHNVLLGAPTGSGKTIAAEIAMFKVFRDRPEAKVVYIAPLKALVRERMEDWKVRFGQKLGKSVVELTGDVTPDVKAIQNSSLIVTTPEKWDGVSRSWQTRNYVKAVALIIIDEIHLLGEDRGPVLEVIVSRTNFISSHTSRKLRIVGLSTALANARDLADWLGIGQVGLYNFKPSVRPVPLEVHISGFPGKHYCPRMASMNKPTFQAIQQYSPTKPVLIFVSSRRQTRVTALELISFLAAEENPKAWLHMDESEMEGITETIKDPNLKLTLAFGIGLHHAGLVERDRKTVEELYVNQKIQVLVATATVAWGVNFPAHLVVIKGTEYFDGKQKRYVDMPITDVLQMMGRAGRPQFDDRGVAHVLVHDVKKHFYKKFLYEPFPVESSLHLVLPDHLNAEIVAGTIQTRQDALDYITWTYFFRRLLQNPSYYGLEGVDEENLNSYMTDTVNEALLTLEESRCLEFDDDDRNVEATTLGCIASYYYLTHSTVQHFCQNLQASMDLEAVLKVLADSHEYNELPVRHNEEFLNADLSKYCPWKVNEFTLDSANTKANLLLQSHFCRNPLPCTDYVTDTKSVLDQAIRILQAMIDVAADMGWLTTTLQVQTLLQMIVQGRWVTDSSLLCLPHVDPHMLYAFKRIRSLATIDGLPEIIHFAGSYENLAKPLRSELDERKIQDIFEAIKRYPKLKVDLALKNMGGRGMKIVPKPGPDRDWVKVSPDSEHTIDITLFRENRFAGHEGKAFAPKFPKPKDEGWFLVLGCVENNELLALRRVGAISRSRKSNQQLTFFTPEKCGRVIYTLYIMSDSYLGLDQQYDICLEVEQDDNDGDDVEEELDEEESRFALLRLEREKLEKRVNLETPRDQQQDFSHLGAKPKSKKV